jgi:hypothetical protein
MECHRCYDELTYQQNFCECGEVNWDRFRFQEMLEQVSVCQEPLTYRTLNFNFMEGANND